jgi:hypothetical protein
MTTVTWQEAQANLPAIISGLQPGEDIPITIKDTSSQP